MKRTIPIAQVFAVLTLVVAPIELTCAADGGGISSATALATLTGTVINSATGRTLQGARVVLKPSGREALTDDQGVYFFADVSPGTAVLSVSYTGLNTLDVQLEIPAGGRGRRDIGLT